MLPQKEQGIKYGLSIAAIGYVLANIVFASVLTITNSREGFIDNLLFLFDKGEGHIYAIAAAVMLISGFLSGALMGNMLRANYSINRTCILGSLLILSFSAIMSGVAIACSESISPYKNFDTNLLFFPMLIVVAFGLIPSLLTGYLFGRYQKFMMTPQVEMLSTEAICVRDSSGTPQRGTSEEYSE